MVTGIFLMEVADLTFRYLMEGLAAIIIGAEIFKKIKEVKSVSDADYARKQSWDNAAKVIKEKEDKWDAALVNMEFGRKNITNHFEKRLDEVDDKMEEQKTDYEAKFQDMKIELFIQTECMRAVLAGLGQLNCNGPVTKAREMLDLYLSKSAHDIDTLMENLKKGA